MRNISIYTAGGMSAFGKENYNKSNSWRMYCKGILENCEGNCNVKVINPNDYYNLLDDTTYERNIEVMEFDLHKVRTSDLIIVNFNNPTSLGTMAEIAIAYEKRIPIIGLNESKYKLHPWQIDMVNKMFINIDEMLEYIKNYYLN